MAIHRARQRNVRVPGPAVEEEEEDDDDEVEEEVVEEDAGSEAWEGAEGGGDVAEDMSDVADEDGKGSVHKQISSVSFGALKQAHEALSRKRKMSADAVPDQQAEKLTALRARLRQLRDKKGVGEPECKEPRHRPSSRRDAAADEERDGHPSADSDSDSAPSEHGLPSHARTSKHAPTAQSSRHQVTRRRTVVDVPKRAIRDPRFDALARRSSTHPTNDNAYAFLTAYQQAEIAELKSALKKTQDEEAKAALRRKMNSMENRLKAKASKEREQEVLRKHRRDERERVEQGKTPYFLKRKEIRERALVEKYKGMKGPEREKLIERRRIKAGQKEKRRMPHPRRTAG